MEIQSLLEISTDFIPIIIIVRDKLGKILESKILITTILLHLFAGKMTEVSWFLDLCADLLICIMFLWKLLNTRENSNSIMFLLLRLLSKFCKTTQKLLLDLVTVISIRLISSKIDMLSPIQPKLFYSET